MIIMQFLFRFVNISLSCFPFTFPSMSNFTVNIEIPPLPLSFPLNIIRSNNTSNIR